MNHLRRHTPAVRAASIAALLLLACLPTLPAAPAGPEPFTGQLTEVPGVQAVVSIRHPKLLNQDLEKLMAGVPEAAMLRAVLMRAEAFGYPEFSEIAAGSNVGVAFTPLFDGPAGVARADPKFILFVKLNTRGNLWNLLTKAEHLAHTRHGDWTLFAKSQADFSRLASPDAVIAQLDKPQAEDIRAWFRATPGLVEQVKAKIREALKPKLETLPEAKRKAALAYLDSICALVSQLHSIDAGLTLGDKGISLTGSYQFYPGSPIGNALSYPPGPRPAVADFVRGDALVAFAARYNPAAQRDLMDQVLDMLIAVDYPPLAEKLRSFRTDYLAIGDSVDGGAAGTIGEPPVFLRHLRTRWQRRGPQVL